MDFKRYIREKKESAKTPDTAVMAFGRYNPPTGEGHGKVFNKVAEVANEHGATAHIIASHSEGTAKNPLTQSKKLEYIRKVVPKNVQVSGSDKQNFSILHQASKLHAAGHKHLVVVAGSDRVDEYQKALDKYNGTTDRHGHYNFKSIKVVSSGERDPDAEDATGMSGSKLRAHAREGNFEAFKSGLHPNLHPHAKEMYDQIRSIKEDYENPHRFDWGTPEGTEYMKKMTPGMKTECGIGEVWSKEKGMCVSIREAYVAGEVYKLNDIVESTGGTKGKIVYRGASYVTIQLESGDTKKIWLKDIQTLQENAPLPRPTIKNRMTKSQVPVLLMTKRQIEEKLAPAKITYKELKEMYKERDINFSDAKEVRMGIDKTIPDQHVDGKAVGLVSFKSYIQGEAARVASEYKKSTDSATIEKSKIDAQAINMDNPQFIRKMRTGE